MQKSSTGGIEITVVAWVSQHEPRPAQIKMLEEKLNDVKLIQIKGTFADYRDVIQQVKNAGASYAVLVLPLSIISLILTSNEGKNITWLRAEMMTLKHNANYYNPETDVMLGYEKSSNRRHYRFSHFSKLKEISVITEPF